MNLMRAGRVLGVLCVFGLVVVGIPIASPGPNEGDEWAIPDGSDDHALQFFFNPLPVEPAILPTSPEMAHADLRAVKINGEDETGFLVTFVVRELRVSPSDTLGAEVASYNLEFKIATSPLQYELRTRIWGSGPTPDAGSTFVAHDAWAYLVMCTERFRCDWPSAGPVTLDDESNEIRVWVPKDALMGLGREEREPIPGAPKNLRSGDQLTDIVATALWESPGECVIFTCAIGLVEASDRAPNTGKAPAYALKTNTANSVVSVKIRDGDPFLGVQKGVNQSIQFTLNNRGDAKRIVPLTYELAGAKEKLAQYAVWGPPTVSIPAGEHRNFTLNLDVKPGADLNDQVQLLVRGTSLGHPEELAYAKASLLPGAALGPAANTLYFHGFYEGPGPPLDQAASAFCANPIAPRCHYGFLSPLADDPQESAHGRIQGGRDVSPDGSLVLRFWVPLPSDLVAPIAFDATKPIEMDLKFIAPVDTSAVTVQAMIVYYSREEDGVLFDSTQTGTIGPSGSLIQLSGVPLLPSTSILPAGTWMATEIVVAASAAPGGAAGVLGRQIDLLAEESKIRLPLTELPVDLKPTAIPKAFQFSLISDREEFVNAGEARLFNVSLLNQGSSVQRAQLKAATPAAGWRTEILPGQVFDLSPGDSVAVGVLVHAPETAKEGDRAEVQLTATATDGSMAAMNLTALATSFDVPNDAGTYRPDEEAQSKLVVPAGEDAPGLEALAILMVLTGLAVGLRRRPQV